MMFLFTHNGWSHWLDLGDVSFSQKQLFNTDGRIQYMWAGKVPYTGEQTDRQASPREQAKLKVIKQAESQKPGTLTISGN